MKVQSRFEIEFAGVLLPVGLDAEGRDVVPLKPITEVFGLEWERQRKGIQTPNLVRRLGVCTVHMYGAGQSREMVCIRLDRVAAYLNQINPERVRAAGNVLGADFLEAKQGEWDDLIHEYESCKGGLMERASAESRVRLLTLRMYLAVLREKRATNDERDRKALARHAELLSAESGSPYQPDLT